MQWAKTRGDICAMVCAVPAPWADKDERVSILYKVDGEPGMAGFDARHFPAIVRVIKGGQGDGPA